MPAGGLAPLDGAIGAGGIEHATSVDPPSPPNCEMTCRPRVATPADAPTGRVASGAAGWMRAITGATPNPPMVRTDGMGIMFTPICCSATAFASAFARVFAEPGAARASSALGGKFAGPGVGARGVGARDAPGLGVRPLPRVFCAVRVRVATMRLMTRSESIDAGAAW